jgi:hypothetical protein
MPEFNEGNPTSEPVSNPEAAQIPEANPDQSILMPKREIMNEKLKENNLFTNTPVIELFYKTIVDQTAERNLTGKEMYQRWLSVKYISLQNQPPEFSLMLDCD